MSPAPPAVPPCRAIRDPGSRQPRPRGLRQRVGAAAPGRRRGPAGERRLRALTAALALLVVVGACAAPAAAGHESAASPDLVVLGAVRSTPRAVPDRSSSLPSAGVPASAVATDAPSASPATPATQTPKPRAGIAGATSVPLSTDVAVPTAPPPVIGGPLPVCRSGELPVISDVITPHDGYDGWARTLLDTRYRLPSTYAPPDLEPVSDAHVAGSGELRAIVMPGLEELAEAAARAGSPIEVVSGYRSYATQVSVFESWVASSGYLSALDSSARPGHSEHQLGIAMDVGALGGPAPWDVRDWATTTAGAWMAANAWRYGWVMSYPAGSLDVTCYAYEPWHYRYVGRDLAARLHASGETLRQWLWSQQ